MATRPKRPRDPFQLAKLVGDISVGLVQDNDPDAGKDRAAMAMGKKGGAARRDSLTPKQRSEIAKKAAQGRWNKP